MRVRDLIEVLEKYDGRNYVVINEHIVSGVREIHGRVRDFGGVFITVPEHKARDKAITFTRLVEHSDGNLDYSRYWGG